MKVFIDSNIPMYAAGRSHPNREPSIALLSRVREGRIAACTSTEVLQEILYRYSALGAPETAAIVYDAFVEICPAILPVALADTDRARELLVSIRGISARDAIHAAVALNHGVEAVATFDTGFDRVPSLRRIVPS
jgi:hypothetical protein